MWSTLSLTSKNLAHRLIHFKVIDRAYITPYKRFKMKLVLSSLLRIDWSVNPSLCLLNDDSGLCISSVQKRMLFAGFTAAKKTIIQNELVLHRTCVEKYIGSVASCK